ncbi:MAG TPA: hypothetical protein PLR88_09050 [Bacteroidales bacterium]|nr:hypothetical protein [Bacteroidales bacterium]HPT22077.1 hypothetical protein [Bacteroidales bacterium]
MYNRSKAVGAVLATFILSLALNGEVFSQSGTAPKVKSVTITEESHEKGSKKTMKDSEKKFDINGNLIEEINYKNGEFDNHTSYEYDSNNNKIKETEFDKSGNKTKVTTVKYDENGLKTEKCVYDGKGTLKSRKSYKYTLF